MQLESNKPNMVLTVKVCRNLTFNLNYKRRDIMKIKGNNPLSSKNKKISNTDIVCSQSRKL